MGYNAPGRPDAARRFPTGPAERQMSVERAITAKLKDGLEPEFLLVENESRMHAGPAAESHFKLTVTARRFEGMSRVARHRHVYGLLAEELAGGVHALALHLYAPGEWAERRRAAPDSPDCRGGSGA